MALLGSLHPSVSRGLTPPRTGVQGGLSRQHFQVQPYFNAYVPGLNTLRGRGGLLGFTVDGVWVQIAGQARRLRYLRLADSGNFDGVFEFFEHHPFVKSLGR